MPFANNDGTRLHYEVHGRGDDTILLIPGLGGGTRQMAGVAAALAATLAATARVVVVDPRGAARSDKPDIPYTGPLFAADMAAVLADARVTAAHVVGISLGGMIAQELASRLPILVRSLVLASTYAAGDAWTARMWEVREGMIRAQGMAAHFRLATMFLFSPAAFRREAATLAAVEAGFAASPPDPVGYLRQLAFARDFDARDRLARIRAPTLVVTGAEDILTSPAQGAELAAGIPGARYRELPQAAHLFMLTDPAAFAGLVATFLCEQGAGAPEAAGELTHQGERS
jgi:aminoacrylate hydrolase